jgi:hypothetical protein
MTTKLVALFILSSALAVFGREPLPAATYALVMDQVSIPGHITGIVEGDTIKVRILAKPEIVSLLLMRQKKARHSTSELNRP